MTRPNNTTDRGSVAVVMCYIVTLAGVLTAFLVEAGTNIEAANKADTYSAEAARAALVAVGPQPNTDGTSALLAARAARDYLLHAGATGTVDVLGPSTVQVVVTVAERSPLLGLTISQTRTHTARLLIGGTQAGER